MKEIDMKNTGMDKKIEKKKWNQQKSLYLGGAILFIVLAFFGFRSLNKKIFKVDASKISIKKVEEGNFQDINTGKYIEIGTVIDNLKMFFGMDFDKINGIKLTKKQRLDLLTLMVHYYQLHLHGFKKPKSLLVLNQIFE